MSKRKTTNTKAEVCPKCGDKTTGFTDSGEAFQCPACKLQIHKLFMGYDITRADLTELLAGKRITNDKKPLQRRDGSGFQAKLWLDDNFEIKLAPRVTQTITEEKCPKCGANLKLIKNKGSEFLGCSNYPKCAFSKKVEADEPKEPAKPSEPTPTDRPVIDLMGNLEVGLATQDPVIEAIEPIDIPSVELIFDTDPLAQPEAPIEETIEKEPASEQASAHEEPTPQEIHLVAAPVINPPEAESAASEQKATEKKYVSNTGIYARIPEFIMEMMRIEPDELTGTKIEITPEPTIQQAQEEPTETQEKNLSPAPVATAPAITQEQPAQEQNPTITQEKSVEVPMPAIHILDPGEELLTTPITQPENLELDLIRKPPKKRPTLT